MWGSTIVFFPQIFSFLLINQILKIVGLRDIQDSNDYVSPWKYNCVEVHLTFEDKMFCLL